MQIQLTSDLTNTLLCQGVEVLKAVKQSSAKNASVFDIRTSGHIVTTLDYEIREYLYDMVFVAKFFCKTGSWLDRFTLRGGRLWIWTCDQQPDEVCHIMIQLDKDKGVVYFPEKHVECPENSLCFGLVFNNL